MLLMFQIQPLAETGATTISSPTAQAASEQRALSEEVKVSWYCLRARSSCSPKICPATASPRIPIGACAVSDRAVSDSCLVNTFFFLHQGGVEEAMGRTKTVAAPAMAPDGDDDHNDVSEDDIRTLWSIKHSELC